MFPPSPVPTGSGHPDRPTDPDAALAARFQAGDVGALDVILQRYRRFARACSRRYFIAGGDGDDLEQEALLGLFKAARDYRPDHEVGFRAFADLCMTRQLLSAIKAANRFKHEPLNRSVSTSATVTSAAEADDRTVGDRLAGPSTDDPVEQLVADERVATLRTAIDRCLTDLESEVLQLYVGGSSYSVIGDRVGRHTKAVDNAVQRIRRKLARELRDDDQLLAVV